jgi:hypothetical protein
MSTTLEVKKIEITNPKFKKIDAIQAGVGEMVIRLSAGKITNQETYDSAMKDLKDAKEILDRLDTAGTEAWGVEEKTVKAGKALLKLISAPIELGIKYKKQRMGQYQYDQERKRQAEIDRLEMEKQKSAAKIETADTAKQQEKEVVKIAKIEAKQEAIADYKPKTADKTRKMEVISPDDVERQYCTPDDKKIRPFIGKPGDPIPTIKGVRIWDEIKIVTR